MPAVTVGLIIGAIVVVLCVLGILGIVPADPRLLFALIGVTALARIV